CLDPFRIGLEVYNTKAAFYDAFNRSPWDFVVVDLFDEKEEPAGFKMAEVVAGAKHSEPWYPIFVFTSYPERLVSVDYPHRLNVLVRPKDTPEWSAVVISQELARSGVLVDQKKVFLIENCNEPVRSAVGDKLRQRLEGVRKLRVESIGRGH